jgi:hypothetical protein
MTALFYVLAVWAYARARTGQIAGHGWRTWAGWYALALAAAAAAVHCKENAVSLPAAIALYEGCFLRRDHPRQWAWVLPFALVAMAAPVAMLLVKGVPGAAGAGEGFRDLPPVTSWQYLLAQCRVLPTYLRLIVLPVGLRVDYDVPVTDQWADPAVMFGLAMGIGLVVVALIARRRHPLVTFVVGWYFVTMSVESSVIPLYDMLFEHRLYLPLAAVAVGVPWWMWSGARMVRRGRADGSVTGAPGRAAAGEPGRPSV